MYSIKSIRYGWFQKGQTSVKAFPDTFRINHASSCPHFTPKLKNYKTILKGMFVCYCILRCVSKLWDWNSIMMTFSQTWWHFVVVCISMSSADNSPMLLTQFVSWTIVVNELNGRRWVYCPWNSIGQFYGSMICLFVCLFVCLFNRSVRVDTCMGPEGTKLKQKPEPDLNDQCVFSYLITSALPPLLLIYH